MRTLRFVVDGQIIVKDPGCDFTNLVPDSEGYLQAEFLFSKEWGEFEKTAHFYSAMGYEYEPQKLKDGKACMIPAEALDKRVFKIQLVGKNGDIYIETNKVKVEQKGLKYDDPIGDEYPDVITQILTKLDAIYDGGILEKVQNKLTEFTEVETDEQYYSAKSTNEMFKALGDLFEIIGDEYNEKFATKTELEALKSELQGDIDSISALVGGAE